MITELLLKTRVVGLYQHATLFTQWYMWSKYSTCTPVSGFLTARNGEHMHYHACTLACRMMYMYNVQVHVRAYTHTLFVGCQLCMNVSVSVCSAVSSSSAAVPRLPLLEPQHAARRELRMDLHGHGPTAVSLLDLILAQHVRTSLAPPAACRRRQDASCWPLNA